MNSRKSHKEYMRRLFRFFLATWQLHVLSIFFALIVVVAISAKDRFLPGLLLGLYIFAVFEIGFIWTQRKLLKAIMDDEISNKKL